MCAQVYDSDALEIFKKPLDLERFYKQPVGRYQRYSNELCLCGMNVEAYFEDLGFDVEYDGDEYTVVDPVED